MSQTSANSALIPLSKSAVVSECLAVTAANATSLTSGSSFTLGIPLHVDGPKMLLTVAGKLYFPPGKYLVTQLTSFTTTILNSDIIEVSLNVVNAGDLLGGNPTEGTVVFSGRTSGVMNDDTNTLTHTALLRLTQYAEVYSRAYFSGTSRPVTAYVAALNVARIP